METAIMGYSRVILGPFRPRSAEVGRWMVEDTGS